MSVEGSPKCWSKYDSSRAQRHGPRAQQFSSHAREVVVPLRDDLPQLGLSRRPEVRSDQPRVVRRGAVGDRLALGPDVDLLAPVHPPLGALAAHARVSAEVGAADVLDRELVRFGQREEVPRGACAAAARAPARCRCRSGRRSRRRASPRAGRRGRMPAASGPASSRRQVENGQGEFSHAPTIGAGRGLRNVCCRALPASARCRFDRRDALTTVTKAGTVDQVRVA